MHVEYMGALAPDERTIVARDLARGATRLEGQAADAAHVLVLVLLVRCGALAGVPAPLGDGVPGLDRDLHAALVRGAVQASESEIPA